MIKVAICDDENNIINQIENQILQISKSESIPIDIEVFYNGKALEREYVLGIQYDIIFLDIEMKNGDGISAAKFIRQCDENVLFVFVSGYEKYMIELFQLEVFAFIKKPIDLNVFTKVFIAAHKKVCNKMFYFLYKYRGVEYKVPCKEIFYFESNARQIRIHKKDESIDFFNGKLSDVEKKLSAGKIPFLRIHQSYLVNYYHIQFRTKKNVTLFNGETLPISEDRQKDFGREYSRLLGGEVDV